MVEKKEEQKPKSEPKEEFVVVPELPQQPIRKFVEEDGKEITIYTIPEALKEILEICRELKKTL